MKNQRKILIFEDDQDLAELLMIILSGYKTEVKRKADEEVVEIALEVNPDLILMDAKLPTIGGEAAIGRLKADDRTKAIPILMYSALGGGEQLAEKAGADAFIAKPFDLEVLKGAIARLLKTE